MTIRQFSKQPPVIFYLCFPFGGLMYASSMTSAFVPDSAIMPAMFGFAYLINLFKANDTDSYNSYHVSGAKLAVPHDFHHVDFRSETLRRRSSKTPYSWWGYTLPNATIGKLQKVPLRTSDAEVRFLHRWSIGQNHQSGCQIFPCQTTMFCSTHTDAVSDPREDTTDRWHSSLVRRRLSSDVMSKDFAQLKRTRPKVVVIFDPPYQTYLGHMEFKRSQLIQQGFFSMDD